MILSNSVSFGVFIHFYELIGADKVCERKGNIRVYVIGSKQESAKKIPRDVIESRSVTRTSVQVLEMKEN